jgi:eukaryotic-like serine/threonine-protein kinase
MAEPPPRPPEDDETVVVPRDETVVDPDWAVPPERRTAIHEVREEEVPPPRRFPTLWPWLLALLVLVLGGLAAAYFLTRDDDEPAATTTTAVQQAEVPRLIGLREEQALEELREEGLEGQVDRRSSREPRGVVIGQNPGAGTELDQGETVQLDVSAGPASGTTTGETTAEPETARVPEVIGLRSSEATAQLRDAGFDVRLVQVPSQEPAGTVVGQNPRAGSEAERGSEVRLNVARQPEGSTQPGTTQPPPATTAPPPQPQPAAVPDVVGQELADAARAFANEGLKVSVRYVPSNEAQGRVVAQAQPAGTELQRGDTVQVNVSIGAEPQPPSSVPRVVGQTLAEARSALEAAGYEVLAVNLEDEVRNENRVSTQTPGGGASVPSGSLVVLYVTSGG